MTQFDAHPLWHAKMAMSSPQIGQSLSPIALAYLGDAVFELYVRSCYLFPPRRIGEFHRYVVSQVRAERQAELLETLTPQLTAEEQDWVRRGRNAAAGSVRRADPKIYQAASGLETLIGYLYLTNPQRLDQLLTSLSLAEGPRS